jgi:hypothetical protein
LADQIDGVAVGPTQTKEPASPAHSCSQSSLTRDVDARFNQTKKLTGERGALLLPTRHRRPTPNARRNQNKKTTA